jgi:hypothetical protein
MAEDSYPNTPHNTRALTEQEYERLVSYVQPSGLCGTPALTALVYADSSGRQVKIRANREGTIRGFHWVSGSTEVTKALAANASGSPRIDLLVLRLTRATWQITVEIKAGTPATVPIAPTVTQDLPGSGVYEIPLAEVQVPNGAAITASGQVTPRAWYVTEYGHILCTPTTLPGHSAGLRVWLSTGISLVSTGLAWVTDYEDTGLVPVTAGPSWTRSPTGFIYVHRVRGMVFVAFDLFRAGGQLNAGTNSLIFTLPTGYWPRTTFFGTFDAYASHGGGRVNYNATNGTVYISAYDSALPTDSVVSGSTFYAL